MLEPDADLDSLSDSRDTLVKANDVLSELVDLEAMLPGEPRSRRWAVASLVQRTGIALGTRNQYGSCLDVEFRRHFPLLSGTVSTISSSSQYQWRSGRKRNDWAVALTLSPTTVSATAPSSRSAFLTSAALTSDALRSG